MTNEAHCYDLRNKLKEIDEHFDIDFNFEHETYSVYFNGYLFQTVPYGGFTRKWFRDRRRTVWVNTNGDPFWEVDKANIDAELRKEKQRMELSENLAKDIRKPLLRELRGA